MSSRTPDNYLAIDTASPVLSVALAAGNSEWYFEADAGSVHSQLIMEVVDMLCEKARITPQELSAVFCMRGPGSFTGLRIGFAGAKGLALALDIPFIPVSTLDCMARPFSMWPGIVIPVIDAKKNAYFYALYSDGNRISSDADAGADTITGQIRETRNRQSGELPHILLTGPDAQKLRDELTQDEEISRSGCLRIAPFCRAGYARELLAIAKEQTATPGDFFAGPDYIRKSDAEINSEKQKENVR